LVDNQKAISNWKKAAKLGNLFAIYNLAHFKEECDELSSEEEKEIDRLNKEFSRKRIDDLEFIEMYDYTKSLLDYPYLKFETSNLENVSAILSQQKKLHDYIIEQCIDNKNILGKVKEIDVRIEQRKNKDKQTMDEFVPFNTVEENEIYRVKEGIEDSLEKRKYYVSLAEEWRI
jgi:hypothetical protein